MRIGVRENNCSPATMVMTDDKMRSKHVKQRASTLSNEGFQQYIMSKMKWFVQNKEWTISFFVKNDNAKDTGKDVSKINQMMRSRNDDMTRKTKVESLDELPDVLIYEIPSFLPCWYCQGIFHCSQ